MFFYIWQLLLTFSAPTFVFNGLNIDIHTISSAPVVNYGSKPNTCGNLLAHYNQLYHTSSANVYQNAHKGSLDAYTTVINVTNPPVQVLSFSVSHKE